SGRSSSERSQAAMSGLDRTDPPSRIIARRRERFPMWMPAGVVVGAAAVSVDAPLRRRGRCGATAPPGAVADRTAWALGGVASGMGPIMGTVSVAAVSLAIA